MDIDKDVEMVEPSQTDSSTSESSDDEDTSEKINDLELQVI